MNTSHTEPQASSHTEAISTSHTRIIAPAQHAACDASHNASSHPSADESQTPSAQDTHPRCLFVTLGCAKNQVDTDRMRALLLASGFEEAQDAMHSDCVIINTCSFLQAATRESIDVTLTLAQKKKKNIKQRPIIMCGCVPSRYGEGLNKELPEVSAFVKANDEDSIVAVVSKVLGLAHPNASFAEELSARALRTVEGTSAFVKISEGCDRMCAFCAIPFIRGHYHSRGALDILSEITMLMKGGVKEIVLIGQDTGIWGQDLDDPQTYTLSWLLAQVAQTIRPYHAWCRVLYLQPEGMTEELIHTIRDTPEILNYIDIPIQHCSETILKRMGRKGSAPELHKLFAHLRAEIPNMVLRTTGMVGFPGESEEEAQELIDFFREEAFDYMSVFSYSQEDGTTASRMRDQVSAQTKLQRTQALRDCAEELGFAATASHVGEVVDVIVDSFDKESNELIGHAWFQAPDCDGCVHLKKDSCKVGDVVRVRLTDAYCYELEGEVLDAS